jgi:pimeloyl-ACP methyl ester carboxylesterase
VVLVHGAFADAGSWSGVIRELQAAGLTVLAPPNPLRGIANDAAYVASVVNAIEGPVILVGHSYGGAIITNAAPKTPNAIALVYVAAFAPDEGEALGSILEKYPTELGTLLRPVSVAVRDSTATEVELSIDPSGFHSVFTADLSAEDSAWMGASQRPIVAAAFGEPSGPAGWKSLPSWYVVATGDHAINPDAERFMAARASATTIEVDASHVVMVSQPTRVVEMIQAAIAATARQAAAV